MYLHYIYSIGGLSRESPDYFGLDLPLGVRYTYGMKPNNDIFDIKWREFAIKRRKRKLPRATKVETVEEFLARGGQVKKVLSEGRALTSSEPVKPKLIWADYTTRS